MQKFWKTDERILCGWAGKTRTLQFEAVALQIRLRLYADYGSESCGNRTVGIALRIRRESESG
jgi:hypothetical protein